MTIILSIFVLMLMIVIHEFGHFSMAKLLHVPVYEFSVGMGPLIKSVKGKKETVYSLRAIPLGGFCRFDKEDIAGIQDTELNKHPVWKRLIILCGGSGFNILSAFIVAIVLVAAIGLPVTTTTIHSIASEEADSFFQPGDTIVSIDGKTVSEFSDITFDTEDGIVHITVLRNNKEVSSDVKLMKAGGEWRMGVNMGYENVKVPILQAVPVSIAYCKDIIVSIFDSLKGLSTGKYKIGDMSGVVGIVSVMGNAAKYNIFLVVHYFIMISINLGIANMLPLPVLDGSKVLFCLIELIFHGRIPAKVEEKLTIAFAYILIGLMLYVTLHDIMRVFGI